MNELECLGALRAHRHEVMNALQVVKGYLQLKRVDQAERALDRLSDRLADFARLQGAVAPEEADILWCAITLGRVRIQRWTTGVCRTVAQVRAVCALLRAVESCAAAGGIDEVRVSAGAEGGDVWLRIAPVMGADDGPEGQRSRDWWHTVQQETARPGVRWEPAEGGARVVRVTG
ncbi:Spo0B domain-containing protein [Alicyclobacillus macrosporangiidus]|uniref:Sensor_kinase_SpoOB-type, alpha-helical domain n=1 Tax=Alicyclobacillus macrosporangiidus TaxID=392015 RepID=A0A1I7JWF8_9BACL|nr:Spo0B domain-containing protein [Alicyclobacillus macrosporangiidus]SFU89532.1 Sensor_kinase_SpoOB-type, alpha-helical domain [Alicyclobacillus macrosporangiidus]